jgi:hypothetical protein
MPTVVVPWLPGCPHRERAWAWLRESYDYDFNVVEALGSEPWCKAAAVMPAVEAAPAGIVIVADADCFAPGIESAVRAVTCGAAEWAVPHRGVNRLTEASTEAFIAGADASTLELDQRAYLGAEGGGVVVAHRDTLLRVPLDPRYVGWGQEDESWGMALHTLAGPCHRVKRPLIHLWHPPQERMERRFGSLEGKALHRRYCAATNNPDAMRALIEEIHDARPTPEPHMHAGDPVGLR